MKAWRNLAGNVQEIVVDVGPDGAPLLPPDTTTDPRPEPLPDHYVTVVGNSWVQIPIPKPYFEFSYLKQIALDKLSAYKAWYLDQPVEVNGSLFDNTEMSRNRMIQTLVIYIQTNFLPAAWIDYHNQPHPISTVDDLKQIMTAMSSSFNQRFFEMETIRQQILAAQDEPALTAINIPSIPTNM